MVTCNFQAHQAEAVSLNVVAGVIVADIKGVGIAAIEGVGVIEVAPTVPVSGRGEPIGDYKEESNCDNPQR